MNAKIYSGFTEVLEKKWKKLEDSSNCFVFQTYAWSKYWYETFCTNSGHTSLYVIVITDDSRKPVLLIPFYLQKKIGLKVLSFIGGNQSDYKSVIADMELLNDINEFNRYYRFAEQYFPFSDVVHFEKVPDFIGNSKNYLLDSHKFQYQESAFSLKLPSNYEELRTIVKSKTINDVKRQIKRLNLVGNLVFDCEVKSVYNNEEIKEMIKQKRARYLATNVPDMFRDERVNDFYTNISKIGPSNFHVHFSTLKLNGEIIATHWGVVYLNRFYFLMPTYLMNEYSIYSPGKVLLNELINWSILNKLDVFDFTIGSEHYKKDWCNREICLYQYVSVITLKGYCYLLIIYLKSFTRRNNLLMNILKSFISVYRKLF